jgi:hypothetical protein
MNTEELFERLLELFEESCHMPCVKRGKCLVDSLEAT